MDLKSTLNLPNADATIPMKANLPILEPSILEFWNDRRVYHEIQGARINAPLYVLHDGPPYTNSPIHLGTALNKILKDFVTKSRTMMGMRAPYVPGFDNHGLPIELAVAKKFAEEKRTPSVVELRKACREHASRYLSVQSEQFQRMGVLGLWERPYATMDYRFEASIIRAFGRIVDRGLIYRGLRPTMWSPSSRTALADTEIVYHDHVSKAIYVRFALRHDPNRLFDNQPNLYTIIWTTTPWTIPANFAVAFNPNFVYAVVRVDPISSGPEGDGEAVRYLVLADKVSHLAQILGWESYEVEETLEGVNMEHAEFSHPLVDRPSRAVLANYVTDLDGTGVVHTAPSHGRDDFYTGQKYGLPTPNTVDERGYLTAEAGEFEGIFYKDCDKTVVDRLAEEGALLLAYDYEHSYPYAERDDKPVIFRATEQWFIDIDAVRPEMLEAVTSVAFTPEAGRNRIEPMLRNRPDWCISRQRPWGVGIPVFYGAESGQPVLDSVAIESVAKLVEEEGSDAWFERDAAEILPEGYRHPETGETAFRKETDVLDVWFDSGSTSLAVLESPIYPEWQQAYPADLYLEGSDQHRGWFNAAMVIGIATTGMAPYRAILTHGFVVDGEGRKMSKRLGNVIDPIEAAGKFGADIVRLWVGSVNYSNDAPCTDAILQQVGESYRNIRNTLRFLLGNLEGFVPQESDEPEIELDAWLCDQIDLLEADVKDAYERFDFGYVTTSIHNFCRETLSKFYLDAVKDRMYCDAREWSSRRSGQIACYYAVTHLVRLIAPVLAFTAEETWQKMVGMGLIPAGTVHAQYFNAPDAGRILEIQESQRQQRMARLRAIRDDVLARFEPFKGTDGIKDSQEATVSITAGAVTIDLLETYTRDELANYFKVSWVELAVGDDAVKFAASPYPKCERSRLRRPDVRTVEWRGESVTLTPRDIRALGIAGTE